LILAEEIYIQKKEVFVQPIHLSRTVIINGVQVQRERERESRFEMFNQGLKYISLKWCLWKAAVRVGNSNSQTFLIKWNGGSGPVGG
jgi:hypothetical protein